MCVSGIKYNTPIEFLPIFIGTYFLRIYYFYWWVDLLWHYCGVCRSQKLASGLLG